MRSTSWNRGMSPKRVGEEKGQGEGQGEREKRERVMEMWTWVARHFLRPLFLYKKLFVHKN